MRQRDDQQNIEMVKAMPPTAGLRFAGIGRSDLVPCLSSIVDKGFHYRGDVRIAARGETWRAVNRLAAPHIAWKPFHNSGITMCQPFGPNAFRDIRDGHACCSRLCYTAPRRRIT